MSKQLNLTEIKKLNKAEYSTTKRVELDNGEFHLDIYEKFKPTSIKKFIVEYIELLTELKTKGVSFEVISGISYVYYMLLIRHFTPKPNNIPKNAEKMYLICEELMNRNILSDIINAFPPEEVAKIDEEMKKFNENTDLLKNTVGELFVDSALKETEDATVQ
nr:hypothetical protein [Mycobacterium sp. E3298]